MADEFSLEDILKEYSDKTSGGGKSGEGPVSEAVSKPVEKASEAPVIPETAPEKKRASEETIGLQIKLGVKAQPAPEPIIADEKGSAVDDISVTALVDKAVEEIEEDEKAEAIPEESVEENEEKPSGNTAIIEKIVKLKKKKEADENPEELQVKRAKPEDVNMELTGKIIPETAQLETVKNVENDKQDDEADASELKKQRQKKVNQFVLKENKMAEPEDDDYDEGEYNSFEQTEDIAEDIAQLKSNLFLRFIVLLVTGLMAAYISVANDFSLPILGIFNRNTSPGGFAFTLTALGLVACFFGYTVVFSGLKNLVTLKADCDSIAALAITASVISGIVMLVNDELARNGDFHIYIAAAILGLLFNTLGKLLIVNRTERNFKYVSGEYDKYAISIVEDEEAALKFTNGAVNELPCLAAMRKTEFIKDFLKNSYSSDVSDSYSRRFAPFMALASLLIAVVGMLLDKNASGTLGHAVAGLSILAGSLSICSSIAIMLVVNVPLARASKRYLQSSAVMLGYSAVEEYADTNSVLVGVEQLFPEGMVDLVNLKATSSTMIEECILLAGSLACQAGSVLKPTFYKILKGKTEMLYPVESYIYEDGLGLSGWIENKRVLLGTRELMENHSIEGIPTAAKEKEYARGNLVLYLSISGVVSALFVIRAKGSAHISKWLRELEKQNITVVIRSVDSFISLNLLSELFRVSPDMFKLLPFRYYKEYDRETSYVPKVSASMLCSGHFQSLAMLISGAKKLQLLSFVGVTIQMSSAILGAVIALIMALLGSFSQLTASVVLCYNLVWLAVTLIAQQLRKV